MRAMNFLVTMSVVVLCCVGCEGGGKGGSSDADTDATDGSSGGDTGEPTGGDDAAGVVCEEFAAWQTMCDPDAGEQDALVAECEDARTTNSACVTEVDAHIECLVSHGCADETACMAEYEAVNGCLFPVSDACAAFGAKQAECNMTDADEEGMFCQFSLEEAAGADQDCRTGYEAYFTCVAGQSCADIEMEEGCEDELNALLTVCEM